MAITTSSSTRVNALAENRMKCLWLSVFISSCCPMTIGQQAGTVKFFLNF
jgi:hypothetical protein